MRAGALACLITHLSSPFTVQAGRLDERAADRKSTRVVLDIIRNIGGDDGLTKEQIVAPAVPQSQGL